MDTPMIDWQLFGQYIKALRINKKLTQKELGEKIGVNYRWIYRTEMNDGNDLISLRKLINICQILNIEPEDLLFVCKDKGNREEAIMKQKLLNKYKLKRHWSIDWKSIKGIIKQTRIKKQIKIIELSEQVKLSQPRIKNIEGNNNKPVKLTTLKKVCEALEINIDQLLEEYRIGK